ncbi:hypothetical protein FRB99_002550 [Tulasnella sp. 403]|nr:hypothetical protein FRB99_002550 [Tulasnella sp. 403]
MPKKKCIAKEIAALVAHPANQDVKPEELAKQLQISNLGQQQILSDNNLAVSA